MELRPGELLGPYHLVGRVGAGGMAEVWRAYQPSLERHVAIKILPRHLAAQPGFVERFRREALAISHLEHPNILSVFDFGEVDDFTYMVTPLVGGGTLEQRVRRPWSMADALRILAPLASALDYAHSQGIVHRDVKPSNVLLTERDWPLLSDFGIVRIVEGSSALTHSGVVLGTPAYMSPEQAAGRPAGPPSDLYSLGVVAYELLTGRVPFHAETPIAVALAHLREPPPPARTINPALSEAVDSVLDRSLAKDPADRFPNGTALVQALASAAWGAPDRGTPPAEPAPPSRLPLATTASSESPRDHPPLGAPSSATLSTVRASARRPETTRPAGRASRSRAWQIGLVAAAMIMGVLVVVALELVLRPRPPSPAPTAVADRPVETRPSEARKPLVEATATTPLVGPTVTLAPAADWRVLAGGRTAPGSFNAPTGVALDERGNLYVAERDNHRVQKLSPGGEPLTQWGGYGTAPGRFDSPGGLVLDGQGNLYLADRDNHRVQKLSRDGQPAALWGGYGTAPGQFAFPSSVAVDGQGNLYVADSGNHRVQKLSPSGQPLAQWGAKGSAAGQFDRPAALVLDAQGNLYVADSGNHRVQKLSPTGQPLAQWGTQGSAAGQFETPSGLAIDGQGNLYVTDGDNHRVQKLSPAGQPLAQWGTYGSGAGQLDSPGGLAVDGSGNVYVADTGNHRLQKLSPTGQVLV